MTLVEIVRIITADSIMLELRIAAWNTLPPEARSKEGIALLEGSLLQNNRVVYWIHLLDAKEKT